jgi:hypothetical protein
MSSRMQEKRARGFTCRCSTVGPRRNGTGQVVRAVAGVLGGGLLVESGSSHHLYGTALVDTAQLRAFLGHAAHFNPVTDGRGSPPAPRGRLRSSAIRKGRRRARDRRDLPRQAGT